MTSFIVACISSTALGIFSAYRNWSVFTALALGLLSSGIIVTAARILVLP